MGMLKKLFGNRNIDELTFPEENNRGKVEVTDGRILFKGSDYYNPNGDIEVDKIDRIYAVVDRDRMKSLTLCSRDSNCSVPVYYKGFRSMYEMLSSCFGLDDTLFLQTIHAKDYSKKLLWKRVFEPTYSITADSSDNYGKGFEIQSPLKQFITWDTPFSELRKNENTDYLYGEKVNALRFKYPVRVGRLLFHNLTAHNNKRDDIAVRFFFADSYSPNADDISYGEIAGCLLKDLGSESIVYQREDEDAKIIDFSINDILFSVEYRYDNEYNFENGYTHLKISNEREYPALLVNEAYESVIEVSDYLLLKDDVSLYADYKYYHYPKRRPPQLDSLFGNKNIIWRDDANGKIGFADAQRSIVLDNSLIKSFTMENLIPAKGGGGAELIVDLNDESITGYRYMYTFKGEYRSMNEYAGKLQSVTGKEILFPPEYSDC